MNLTEFEITITETIETKMLLTASSAEQAEEFAKEYWVSGNKIPELEVARKTEFKAVNAHYDD